MIDWIQIIDCLPSTCFIEEMLSAELHIILFYFEYLFNYYLYSFSSNLFMNFTFLLHSRHVYHYCADNVHTTKYDGNIWPKEKHYYISGYGQVRKGPLPWLAYYPVIIMTFIIMSFSCRWRSGRSRCTGTEVGGTSWVRTRPPCSSPSWTPPQRPSRSMTPSRTSSCIFPGLKKLSQSQHS